MFLKYSMVNGFFRLDSVHILAWLRVRFDLDRPSADEVG